MALHTLTITVVNAEDLPRADTFSKSDPFVQVKVGSVIKKTSVKRNDQNPHYGETFHFNITNEKKIDIEVFDDDAVGSDSMGVGKVPLPLP